MADPLIYIVRADMPGDFIDDHHDWYARKHAPDVLGVGFWSARGYDSPVAPRMWNIYEVPNVALFASDAYNNMHKADPFVAIAVKKLVGRTVSVYTQLACVVADRTTASVIPTLYGPTLSSLRFDSDADGDHVMAWFQLAVEQLIGSKGLRSIRLWEQREQHPKWQSTEPRWTVAAEWITEEDCDTAKCRRKLHEAATDPKLKANNSQFDIVQKRYGLVREDAFADTARRYPLSDRPAPMKTWLVY